MNALLDLDEEMLVTLRDVHDEQWTRTEMLLATVVDLLQLVAHNALIGPHVDPKALRKLKAPEPLERPGVSSKRHRRGTTLGDLAKQGFRPQYVEGVTHG